MKHHYTALIGLAFLFTGTAATAQEDMQAKINTILETLEAHKDVIQSHLENISTLEKKNAELEQRLADTQTTANTAVSKADAAQTTASIAVSSATAAQNTANSGVSKADAAQAAANTANGKYCYITGTGFGLQWYSCPYGGSYKGGITIQKPVAGINQQEVWKDSTYLWLCCL
jgi:regulator of replication initiation timing